MRQKKILINTFSLRDGGGQTHLQKIIEYLSKKRNFTVVLLVSPNSTLKIDRNDIKILKIRFPVENPLLRAVWEILFLPFILKRDSIDVLFCPGGVISTKVPKGCKTATMFRNMIPFDDLQLSKMPFGLIKIRNLILKRIMLKSMKRADLVIFISSYAEKIINKSLRKPLKRKALITHGVDFDSSRNQDLDISFITDNKPYILYPSSIDSYKSQLEVIRSFNIISERIKNLPKLLLVGGVSQNPKYVQEVKDEIKLYNLEKRIQLTGKVDYSYMPALYNQASFIIFASQSENCPNILLEAMSSGKMILCSNFEPMPEFAEDSVLYFNPTYPNDLADQIEGIYKNSDVFDLYAKRARNHSKKFSWKQTSKKTWDLLNSVN